MEHVELRILITVLVTAAIQSVFGVGVLLFGTPLLLLLGYGFIPALTVLLPISVCINLVQIVMHRAHVDWALFRRILVYTIPLVVVCLVAVEKAKFNIGLIVGPFLIFVALKDASTRVGAAVERMLRYERSYLVVMGIVHGLTNLGGSLLTALVHGRSYPKDATRVNTAISYCTFAVFQIATLAITGKNLHVDYAVHAIYVAVGLAVFVLVDRLWYRTLDDRRYRRLFAVFLFVSGVLLIYKAVAP